MEHITFIIRKSIKKTFLFCVIEEISQLLLSSSNTCSICTFLIFIDCIYFTSVHRNIELVRHHFLVLADLPMCLLLKINPWEVRTLFRDYETF